MKYKDRKKCALVNGHGMTLDLRCPQWSESKACKGSVCDGCELFEVYLRFRTTSMKLKEREECLMN